MTRVAAVGHRRAADEAPPPANRAILSPKFGRINKTACARGAAGAGKKPGNRGQILRPIAATTSAPPGLRFGFAAPLDYDWAKASQSRARTNLAK